VNEFEQCRSQALTLTKSLSYVEDCYTSIASSLKAHGHEATQLMFTDNARGELSFHETFTSSLKEGVVHVEADQYAHLPKLALPEDIPLVYYDTADLIDSTCESLLQRAQFDPSHRLVIGFHMEYKVESDGQSGVISKSTTGGCDVIQIAVSDAVYVFKVNCN
jgi:hypothetical protein